MPVTVRGTSKTRHPLLERATTAVAIVAVALVAAVWAAPLAGAAAGERARVPPVRVHTMALPGGSLHAMPRAAAASAATSTTTAGGARAADTAAEPSPVTLDAGMQFTMVGVICDVPDTGGAVTVRLRTSIDGVAWNPWVETPLEVADEVGGEPQAFTDPLWTGTARYVQVSAAAAGAGAPVLTGARLVAIDPTAGAAASAPVAGAVRRLASAATDAGLAAPASAAANGLTIVTRAEWGADESLRRESPSYATVKMAFVHHTAGGNAYAREDSAALVRGIYAYHTKSLGWSDLGYNFLIDRFGTVYEGRYGGVTKGVVGAQVLGFNTGSTGISVMGTFTGLAPPAEALSSLEKLLVWKLATHGLDPAGTAALTCGATQKYKEGATVTFPVIAGHRDANFTECPGTELYALLPALRSEIARRLQAPIVARLTASETLISPNRDGVLEATDLGLTLSTAAAWTLTLRGPADAAVAAWSGQGTAAKIRWDGAGSSHSAVPDGVYTARLTATSALSEAVPASVTITVDTVAPGLSSAAAAPATFSPNGDGRSETARVTYKPAESCAVRVGIQDADGSVLRWLHGWRDQGIGGASSAWDGRVWSGGKLVAAADGRYKFVVERRDAAGNLARQGCKVTVDRTLGFPTASPPTISPDGDGRGDSTTIGFRLTRRATVTVSVQLDAQTVRTLKLGALGAGTHAALWNGKTAAGAALDSSRPTFTVTAVSSLSESSVTMSLVVDCYRPRLYATSSTTVTLGSTAKMSVKASDPFSAKVDLRYTIVDAKGRGVASSHPGWIPTGDPLSIIWKPKARGVYTVVYQSTDLGGNRELSPARTRLTVR